MASVLLFFGALIAYVGGGGALIISIFFEPMLSKAVHLTILYIGLWAIGIGGGMMVLATIIASIIVTHELRQETPKASR